MKRPLERDKLCPGSVPVLHPTEWQEGTSACFSSTFTKCYSLVGHSLASGSRLALIIQAPEPCEGGMRPLDCRARNSEVYLSMSKCLSRVVLLLTDSGYHLLGTEALTDTFPLLPLFFLQCAQILQ